MVADYWPIPKRQDKIQRGWDMTSEDEKRLVEILTGISFKNDKEPWRDILLPLAKAAREFRETDELRCGDEVQVRSAGTACWVTGIYVGKVASYAPHFVYHNGRVGEWDTDHFRLKPKAESHLLCQVALMQWFDDHDWRPDCDGVYRHLDYKESFAPCMWQYCGWRVDDIQLGCVMFMEPWVVEVEVGR